MSNKNFLPAGPKRLSIYVPRDIGKRAHVSYYDSRNELVRITKGINDPKTYEGRVAKGKEMMREIRASYEPALSLEEKAWAWIESRKPHLRQKSYYGYCSKLRIFLRFLDGREVSRASVTAYFAYRAGRVAGGTLKDDQIYLNRVFSSITDERFFDHIELPKFYAETKEHYQANQIQIIKKYLLENDPQLWFACQCVYYLFLRPGSELRLLKVHHFQLHRLQVKVPPSISKTRKMEFIRIPSGFVSAIKEHIAGKSPNEYMFPAVFRANQPIGKNTMMNRYRKAMKTLGFGAGYSMYSWKNTGAIDLINRGVKVKKLSIQMRHSSLEMTDRYLKKMGVNDVDDSDLNFTLI